MLNRICYLAGFSWFSFLLKVNLVSPENSANIYLVFVRADVAETNKTEGEQVKFFLCREGFKKDKQKSVT